jgi:phage/plasmid-like protein (TIGR03299 family)
VLAKLPGHIRIIGDDIADKFVLLSNGHDGTAAVRIGLTPIRVVCQNTLSLALRGMGGLSIRHYPDVAKRVQQAHSILRLVNERLHDAEQVMQQMARTPMAGGRLRAYFEQVMPTTEGTEVHRDLVKHRHDRLAELFETGEGNNLPGVRGTAWAAYNAVTQWADRESYTRRNKEPLNTIWFGDAARLKQRAFDTAQALLSVN